jgi:uncharacterized protein HemY
VSFFFFVRYFLLLLLMLLMLAVRAQRWENDRKDEQANKRTNKGANPKESVLYRRCKKATSELNEESIYYTQPELLARKT